MKRAFYSLLLLLAGYGAAAAIERVIEHWLISHRSAAATVRGVHA
jgi:hypothetical protein